MFSLRKSGVFRPFSSVKMSVALGAWRWWLCDETDYSPTQVALCSNLSLHWHSPNPENPRKPPSSTLLPNLPEMIFNPTPFHLTFNPSNHNPRNDCSRKQSWVVTLERSSTVRAGGLRLTVRHVFGRAGSQPASLAHGPKPRSEFAFQTQPNTRALCVFVPARSCVTRISSSGRRSR